MASSGRCGFWAAKTSSASEQARLGTLSPDDAVDFRTVEVSLFRSWSCPLLLSSSSSTLIFSSLSSSLSCSLCGFSSSLDNEDVPDLSMATSNGSDEASFDLLVVEMSRHGVPSLGEDDEDDDNHELDISHADDEEGQGNGCC